ncbi:MAG: TolC family protein [Candidatus Eisenbacteria bacterium]
MSTRDLLLELDGVSVQYGEQRALHGVSFALERGEMFGLIGPDGAGKTSCLRSILGLQHPSAGQIRVFGLDPWIHRRALSARVGYLSQRFSIYGDLTIDENVAFFAEAHGVHDWRPRRDELLARLKLESFRARLADRLSGGMKQKLALACTLVHTPELLVLDEPTTGVDPVSRREFWRILGELQREGLTLIVTTPYLDEAERCQRVGLIDRGHLLGVDPPASIRASERRTMVELIARPRRQVQELLEHSALTNEVEVFGERLHVTLAEGNHDPEALRRELSAGGATVDSLRAISPSLEDVFIARLRARETEARSASPSLGALLLAASLISGALSGLTTMARAQSGIAADTLHLSLEQAITEATARSSRLAALDARADAARGGVQAARAGRFPTVNLSAGYSRLSEVDPFSLTLPVGGKLELFPNPSDRYRARAGATWPLFTGGRIGAAIDAAEQGATASHEARESGRLDLVLETTNAYWSLVTAREEARVSREGARTLDAHFLDAEKRVEVGLAARNDLLAVEVERDRAELARIAAESRAADAEDELRRLLARDEAIVPRDSLTLSPPEPQAIAALKARAREGNPDRAALQARARAAEAKVRGARGTLWPQAALNAGYDYARPNPRFVPSRDQWDDSWDVSLSVSLDLWNGGKTSGEIRAARGEAMAARADLDDFDRRLDREVGTRARNLETAVAASRVAESAVASARENLRVSQDRYRTGVITSSELLDAETSLLRAELERTSALARVHVAAVALDRVVGR